MDVDGRDSGPVARTLEETEKNHVKYYNNNHSLVFRLRFNHVTFTKHSAPSRPEVMSECTGTSFPPTCIYGVDRDNLTVTILMKQESFTQTAVIGHKSFEAFIDFLFTAIFYQHMLLRN